MKINCALCSIITRRLIGAPVKRSKCPGPLFLGLGNPASSPFAMWRSRSLVCASPGECV